MTTLSPRASTDARMDHQYGRCTITSHNLDVQEIMSFVGDDSAGAVAVFVGTTRNSFKGRVVTRLEYQAYSKLALKTMTGIIEDAVHSVSRSEHQAESQSPTSSLVRCAISHRIGTVPVGEPSIVIAVSSPHRKEAFVACEQILEDVKKKAQIWKREFYEGMDENDAEWKANT